MQEIKVFSLKSTYAIMKYKKFPGRNLSMNRKLRQPGADLYQYQKLILSAEETASGYGWGFSPADFLCPVSAVAINCGIRGIFAYGKRVVSDGAAEER
ncbi:MAG: hypothetical protein UC961_00995 [Emergencia sp.]|nr:hypothetical protein [Emergencia sp.]